MGPKNRIGPCKASRGSESLQSEIDAELDRRYLSFGFAKYKTHDCKGPRDMREKLETGVKNGDCLLACLAAALQSMHLGHILPQDMEVAAARLRRDLIEWIKEKWFYPCVFNSSMCYHSIIALQHDAGITAEERLDIGEWPEDPQERLERYNQQCDILYGSPAEMLCFSCMMHEMTGVAIMCRTWRCCNRNDRINGTMIQTAPDVSGFADFGVKDIVVIDLEHVGGLDSTSSHYKLLDSASLLNQIEVQNRAHAIQLSPEKQSRGGKRKMEYIDDVKDEEWIKLGGGDCYADVVVKTEVDDDEPIVVN